MPPKFSLALSGPKKPSGPIAKPKRPHTSLQDSDDEDGGLQQAQSVSHFDQAAGGAIDVDQVGEKDGPLVIKSQANRNWQEQTRRNRQRNLLPPEAQHAQSKNTVDKGGDDTVNGAQISYGLNIAKKLEDPDVTPSPETGDDSRQDEKLAPPIEKTDDQLALEALLGEKPKSNLVLPAVQSEEDAFKRDYHSAPDMATLEEYEAVPVSEFGAALLRGMGWKDGDPIGKKRGGQTVKPRLLERRPALLGIGAKEDAAAGIELGSWGKGGKGGKRKVEQVYTPVLLRNTKTGEQLTEEELKVKMEQQKMVEQDTKSGRDHGHDRDRNRDRDRDRDRDRERNRDRDRDSDRKRSDRRHDYDDRSDRRDKDHSRKYRDRDRDYDSKYRSRRERSSSADSYHRRRQDRSDRDRRSRSRHRESRRKSPRRSRASSPSSDYDDRKDHRRRKDRDQGRERSRDRRTDGYESRRR